MRKAYINTIFTNLYDVSHCNLYSNPIKGAKGNFSDCSKKIKNLFLYNYQNVGVELSFIILKYLILVIYFYSNF